MQVIVSLKDTATQAFGTPFFVHAPAQAVRSLRDAVNDKDSKSDIARHPEDFELYDIGEFDELTGQITARNSPLFVCRAKDLRDAE